MEYQEQSYWCGSVATSREHVPPKCLFPEEKDIKEIIRKNFRKNLIIVPSCDEHNLRKSNQEDDIIETENAKFPIQWVNVNMSRLFHSFESIARALYYYDFGVRFEGECQIVTQPCFHPDAMKSAIFNARACKMIDMEMSHWKAEIKWSNPEIFTYQFSPEDGMKVRTLCLTFYKKTKIFVALSRMAKEEFDLQRQKHKGII